MAQVVQAGDCVVLDATFLLEAYTQKPCDLLAREIAREPDSGSQHQRLGLSRRKRGEASTESHDQSAEGGLWQQRELGAVARARSLRPGRGDPIAG